MKNQHDATAAARNSQKHRRLASERRGAVAQRVSTLFGFWALLAQIAPLAAVAQSQSFTPALDEGNDAASLTQVAEWIGQTASLSSDSQGSDATTITRSSTRGFVEIAPMGSESGTNTSYGLGAVASGSSATALGYRANASGSYSTALGRYANASGTSSTALGVSSYANGQHATALGRLAAARGSRSTALGSSAAAIGNDSMALGGERGQR